jgi:hypothetical protein
VGGKEEKWSRRHARSFSFAPPVKTIPDKQAVNEPTLASLVYVIRLELRKGRLAASDVSSGEILE